MAEEIIQLSDREREILKLVATGSTNQQIANELGISINTVKVHLRNAFGKIGVTSRTEATLYAVRVGLVNVVSDVQAGLVPAVPEMYSAVPEIVLPTNSSLSVGEHAEAVAMQHMVASAGTSLLDSPPQQPNQTPRIVSRMRSGVIIAGTLGGLALALLIIWLVQRPEPVATLSMPTDNGQQVAISELTPDWQLRAPLPVVQEAAAAVSLDGQIFLLGGRNAEGITGAVWRYDPESDTWRPLNAKPTPVTDVQAIALNGKIFVPGGETADGTVSDILEVYDPVQGSWIRAAPVPAPRSAYGLAVLEGRIYLFGGWNGNEVQSAVFAYDPRNDTWTTQTAMPTARAYAGAVALDGKIYVIGGEDSSGSLRMNEAYAPANEGRQPWTSRAPLLMARSHFGTGALANLIYVLGGVPQAEPLYYDIRTDTWQTLPSPDVSLGVQPAVTQRDSSLFIVNSSVEQGSSTLYEFRLLYTLTVPIR